MKIRKQIWLLALIVASVLAVLTIKILKPSPKTEITSIKVLPETNHPPLSQVELSTSQNETQEMDSLIETKLSMTNQERPNSISLERILAAKEAQYGAVKAPLDEVDLHNVMGRKFTKAEWSNAGSRNISSLIETYYFSMREGDLARMSNCFSPMELLVWPIHVKGRESVRVQEFSTALHDETEYQIQSIIEWAANEYIVNVSHTMANGTIVPERFAVMNISNEWKIAGARGFLRYPHHSGDVARYERPTEQ